MWPRRDDDRDLPVPSDLAARLTAYVDGQLDEAERARLEVWLDCHPEVRAEIEGQRRLADWYADQPVPAPDEAAWGRVLRQVESEFSPREAPARPSRRVAPYLAAAAVVLALLGFVAVRFLQSPDRPTPPNADSLPVAGLEDVTIDYMDPRDLRAIVVGEPVRTFPLRPGEVLEVATAEEVIIISLDAADVTALAVGAPPVDGPLELTGVGDVTLNHMESFPVDDRKPFLFVPKEGSPMLVSPLKTARSER
jgi:hypothetical protein